MRGSSTPAFAQKTADPAKPFVTYKVGSAEVTAIYDGIWEKPHDPAFITNASVDDVKAAMVKAGLPADFVSIPFTVVGGQERRQDHHVRQRHRRAGAADCRQARRQHEGGRHRCRQDRHHPDLALPSRSHLRADGEGHQQSGLSQCRDRDLGRGVQVLDRPFGHRPLAGGEEGPGAPHPGDVPELEEYPSGGGRGAKSRPASASCCRRATRPDTARSIWRRDRTS